MATDTVTKANTHTYMKAPFMLHSIYTYKMDYVYVYVHCIYIYLYVCI